MSMLDRYRKPGGFLQLLSLMETTGPSKQEKFFEIIRSEDPRWADELKIKMIDTKKIFSWKDEVLSEIVGRSHDLTLATVLFAAPPEQRVRIKELMSHSRWRKIDEITSTSKPQPQEIATMQIKMIETVRAMIKEGVIRLEKVDSSLIIEDKIEDKLGKHSAQEAREEQVPHDPAADVHDAPEIEPETVNLGTSRLSDAERNELTVLRKKFAEVTKENASLRQEVFNLRNKLEQIRRIA